MTLFTGCVTDEIDVMREFLQKSKNFPEIQRIYEQGLFDTIVVNDEDGLVLLRFHSPPNNISNYTYFAWSRNDKVPLRSLDGLYWISIEKRYQAIFHADDIRVPEDGIILHHGPLESPVISSVKVQGDPLVIGNSKGLESYGDLWMNTWADDDVVYTGWGDGNGFGKVFTDMGFACFNGSLPLITGENLYLDPFNDSDPLHENNKPSSLLFYNKTLYAQVHSPLGDADIGYIMYSKDYGRSWTKLQENSPWTKSADSPFRCLFFINMGKDYGLNTDGYVYAFGIGMEWNWLGPIYLARVPQKSIIDYDRYEYLVDVKENDPIWSNSSFDAQPLKGIITSDQCSAMYHPETQRFLILTTDYVYDAAYPWGPWCFSGEWVRPGWYGYQPGIIAKNTTQNSFWFTIAGQQSPDEGGVSYQCNIGKMMLDLR